MLQRISSILVLISVWACSPHAFGQKIELRNPSFEDLPRHSATPSGWYNCGAQDESPPDIQPNPTFKVNHPSLHRRTYLGMVARDNDTWEGIAQRLQKPIKNGKRYKCSVYLSRSNTYISISKVTRVEENFNKPIKLRIWGGNSYCHKKQLLAESPLIGHTDWRRYEIKFKKAKGTYNYIFLEAFYKTPTLMPYNGNILVDNISTIVRIEDKIIEQKPTLKKKQKRNIPITKPKKKRKPKPKVNESKVREVEGKPIKQPKKKPPVKKPVKKPNFIINPDLAKPVKKGLEVRIKRLNFEADSFNIKKEHHASLKELYDFLAYNKKVKVEVSGHTNNVPKDDYCDRLSALRAKAVFQYLINKGIPQNRLIHKGYGKRKPKYRNDTHNGRKLNQRVEVKVLSTG